MATLYIEEYQSLHRDAQGAVSPIPGEAVTQQKVSVGGASQQSSAVQQHTRYVCLTTDTACQFAIGANPTASGTSRYLPANVPRFFPIRGGQIIATIAQQ